MDIISTIPYQCFQKRQGKKLDHWITIRKPSLDCLDGILCLPDSLQNP
jgi:hypothetical protein